MSEKTATLKLTPFRLPTLKEVDDQLVSIYTQKSQLLHAARILEAQIRFQSVVMESGANQDWQDRAAYVNELLKKLE